MIETNASDVAEQARRIAERKRAFAKRFKEAHPAMKQISIMLDQWTKRNLQTQGGNVGGWVPFSYGGRLAPFKPGSRGGVYANRGGKRPPRANATDIASGRGINTSAKLLQDTGHLRMSILPFATSEEAGIGSFLPYSKNHEEGIGVPQRRILPTVGEIGPQARTIYEDWMRVHIEDMVK